MLRRPVLILCFLVQWNNLLGAGEPAPQVSATRPGVRLTMVAEHPDLATPTGIDVDEQGRVWVVATHTHMRPENYVGPVHDEILVFNVSQDKPTRQVFYNATTATMDLELGADGWVYLAERDRILRIKDTDGDGVADVEEDIVTLKTEADYPHNGLSGMSWHPDGDLIFGLGENFAKPWTLSGSHGVTIEGAAQGGIFRCAADGKKLRWIAKGLWNPFGTCVREDGEIFAAENDPGERPPCRLLHIIEGGEYGYRRQYGPEAHHPFVCWNGELPGTLPMIHPTGEAPCGVVPLGRGLLVPSWGDHRIDFLPLKQKGASYSADLITIAKGGRYFRPTCIAQDRNVVDGRRVWYLADWVDGRYNAHGFGRLWKLEIDIMEADWIGPMELEASTQKAKLAKNLRNGNISFNREKLLRVANNDDPFLSRSALVALSRDANQWNSDEVTQWAPEDRAQAVMALDLGNADTEKWLPLFLQDESSHVRIQALRWIANSDLKQFLPDIEKILNQSEISYRMFEAAMATWNTLNDQPEAGVRNVDVLLARVKDKQSSPRLRAYALRLLPTQSNSAPSDGKLPVKKFPKGLSLEVLREMQALNHEELSLEVIRTASGNPQVTHELLLETAIDKGHSATLRAEAIAGLAAVANSYAETLLSLTSDEHSSVREEAIRSLRAIPLSDDQKNTLGQISKKHPESSDLIAAVLNPKSLKSERPKTTETHAWLQLLREIPGAADVENGRRVFHHARIGTCSHCHRHNGRGNTVGPDLTLLNKRATRESLLTSILEPSREMAPEFQPRTLLLKDGRVFTGIRLRSYTKEQIRNAHGQTQTFNKGDVESIKDSNVSFMPADLVDSLTIRELRDLIAFLMHDSERLAQNKAVSNSDSKLNEHAFAKQKPLVRSVDLEIGESENVQLSNGKATVIKLLDVVETKDSIREAVRSAKVTVDVDGEIITIESGMYNLPQRVSDVQIDSPVTGGYNVNGTPAFWELKKAARLRVWPKNSPLITPGSFSYPVDQRWFATRTWFDNEPVDGGTKILPKIYYHSGLDIGASEAQVKVLAATDALVVSVGDQVLEGHRKGSPVAPRYDVVYLLDRRGWYYRYSHLHKINEDILPGRYIDQGTEIGLVGKQGASGGWSHLHFEIKSLQPSGEWGTQAGYAFLWEAYRKQYNPVLVANTRRKNFIFAGERATLDATKSWCAQGKIQSYDWTFSDGTQASGLSVTRLYPKPGLYSEILKVTDSAGNVDYDFAEVHVVDPATPDRYAPGIHAVYWPTFNNRVNQPITFKVRSFREASDGEIWNFGDGSPPVHVKSDGNANPHAKNGYAVTHHIYRKPGDYLVRVQRTTASGQTATARLHVRVDSDQSSKN